MSSDLTQLQDLTHAQYEAERARLAVFLKQEQTLRRDLSRLNAQLSALHDMPYDDLQGAQRVGAEMRWRKWLEAARAEATRKLARHLSRKETVLSGLRRSFGRYEAAQDLVHAAHIERRRLADRARHATVEERVSWDVRDGGKNPSV